MFIPDNLVYLLALIPFCIIWCGFFLKRKDLRKEMIFISPFIGIVSVFSSYFWWTKDWWRPLNITGTVVGVEDFIMGFAAGGIMAVIYKVLFNDALYSKYRIKLHRLAAFFLILFMAVLTAWLIFSIGLTTFWSSVVSMLFVILFIDYMRKDLIVDSLISGVAMLSISILFYVVILLVSDAWVDKTYLHGLSGVRVYNIPIEEFVFWFLAGMWVGPFYEYALGKRLRRRPK